MQMESTRRPLTEVEADWLIVGVFESEGFSGPAAKLDEALGGLLGRLRSAGDLTGKLAETLPVREVTGIAARRLLLVGLGRPQDFTAAALERALMTATRQASERKDRDVAIAMPEIHAMPLVRCAELAATAAIVGSVGQGLYQREPARFPFQNVTIVSSSGEEAELARAVERGRILGEAVNLTRELVNRAPADIHPASFALRAEQLAEEHGLTCEVFDEDRLKAERMGSLLGVSQGSDQPPRMVVLSHQTGGTGAPTLALVGKGVTFDSGGLSLKPTDSMKAMKGDMAGAATVLGAMTAIARLGLPVNVVGLMGLVENMISGSSYKLGDVLTARNGTTIEVLNTDAEGRLVLADVLSYAADRGVAKMIDLATLTGSCVVALGEDVTGVFSNDEAWQTEVIDAARRCGEDVWPMPMLDGFGEQLKSEVADVKNVGTRWGGASVAAKFLERFVGETPWVHLDIAGPSFASSTKPHREGGGTGAMLRTIVEVAARFR
ncbi:MAG: leucyl aminopeptidase [Planctomycetaceae bacterium]